MKASSHILYPEWSYAIIGAAMDIHNRLGPGWDEEACHLALMHALHSKGLKAESKRRGTLMHRDRASHQFEMDILVEDSIVLELKNIIAPFAPIHYVQLINYLKFWKKSLGILINFGLDRLQYTRVPYTPVEGAVTHAGEWDGFLRAAPEAAALMEDLLRAILEQHGLGYHGAIYKELFKAECSYRQITCEQPRINLKFDDIALGMRDMDAFRIDSRLLVIVTAMGNSCTAIDKLRMMHYLRQAQLSVGLIANFGQNTLELFPVQP